MSQPLLPLRIVVDRNRAGAYIAVFTGVIATFGMFLFLTYYMQGTLHYSPVVTGVAYLPMIVALIGSAQLATNVLLPRFGPKFMVATGMVIAAVAMLLLHAHRAALELRDRDPPGARHPGSRVRARSWRPR